MDVIGYDSVVVAMTDARGRVAVCLIVLVL